MRKLFAALAHDKGIKNITHLSSLKLASKTVLGGNFTENGLYGNKTHRREYAENMT
jgi:hypothetical protein